MKSEITDNRGQPILNSAERLLLHIWGFLGLWSISHIDIYGINYVGFIIIGLATWALSFDSKFNADDSLVFQNALNKTALWSRYLLMAFCLVTMLVGDFMLFYWIFTGDIVTVRLYLSDLKWTGLPDFFSNSGFALQAELR